MPTDEPEETKTSMEKQRVFPEAPGEKGNLPPVEERMSNSRRVQRSCYYVQRENWKGRAQLELNLPVGIKENKKLLQIY